MRKLSWPGVVALIVACSTVGAGASPRRVLPAQAGDLVVDARVLLASAAVGGVAAWDPRGNEIAVWAADGTRQFSCVVVDARLGTDTVAFAVRGRKALLAFVDPEAGKEGRRKAVVVDLTSCQVEVAFAFAGLVTNVVPARGEWGVVASSSSLGSPERTFSLVDDRGNVVRVFDVAREFDRTVKERPTAPQHGTRGARMVAVGDEIWLLPGASYELWRPAQRGESFRAVRPPPCLGAEGITLTGEENTRYIESLVQTWPEEMRRDFAHARENGSLAPSHRAATTAAVANGRCLAIVVRDSASREPDRLDLWDMLNERIVAVVPFPASATLVSLGDAFVWVRDEARRLRRLPLPDLDQSPDDPCEALAGVRQASRRAPVAGPTPTPPPSALPPGAPPG